MKTIKTKSSGQQLRLLAGMIAEVAHPYTPEEEAQELYSYRDYLMEESDPGRALRRAKMRREAEEEEERKQSELYPARSYINMTPNALPESTHRESGVTKLNPLSDKEVGEEMLLLYAEKKDYMPDDVFKNVLDKLSEPDVLPWHLKSPMTWAAEKLGNGINLSLLKAAGYVLQWFIDSALGAINAYRLSSQAEEKLAAFKLFYSYSEKAQKDAFERYKNQLGITDKDILQDGKTVIKQNKKQYDAAEEIYNQLTSPEAKVKDYYTRLGETIYDPRRNPDVAGGSRGYWSDMSTQFLLNMNDAQIGDFQGRIDRSREIEDRGKDAIKYYENSSKIKELDSKIDEFYNNPVSYINSAEGLNVIKQLTLEKEQLLKENSVLEENKKAFENYVPSGYGDRLMLGLTKIGSDLENKVFGTKFYDWTSPMFDDVDVLRQNLEGFNEFDDVNVKRNILQRYIDARKHKIQAWLKGIELNEKDKLRHSNDHQISDYYKFWELQASGNIFSGDTWAFKQPGLMGYSMSSWIKQAPMYIGALIASYGTAGVRGALAGLGMAGGHSSAQSENYMELRENYIPRVKLYLKNAGEDIYEKFIFGGYKTLTEELSKLSDEEAEKLIINNYLDGIYNPVDNVQAIYEATAKAAYGLNALFDRDMVAVDMDNLVNTMILFNPFGQLAKGAKFTTQEAGAIKNITRTALESAANPVSITMAPATILARKAIDDATTFLATVPGKIYERAKKIAPQAIKTSKTRDFARKLERVVRDPSKFATTKVSIQNLKKLAYGITESGISEGIEEGKQWLHGHAFLSGELDNADVTFGIGIPDWGKWYDDMTAGLHSAYIIAGFPLNMEATHDPELVENIKGGIMGGLFQTGTSKVMQTALLLPSLVKLNKYMLNNVYAEKAARTDLYEKAKLYAQKALSKEDTGYILGRFDSLIKAHQEARKRGDEWALPEGLIELQKQLFLSVSQMANSQEVRDRLKQLDIQVGDEKYAQFIGQLALQLDLLSSSYNNKYKYWLEFSRKLEETGPIYFINDHGVIMRRTGSVDLPYTGMTIPGESAERTVDRLNLRYARDTQTALALKVILDMLAQLEVSDDENTFGNSRWSRDFMKHRLTAYMNSRLSFLPKNELQTLLQSLDSVIKTLPNSEEFYDIYRKITLASIDNDYSQMMYQGLMGRMTKIQTEEPVDHASPDYLYDDPDYTTTFDRISKAFETRLSGDNALYDALEQDYILRFELIERKRNTARRAAFMAQHPEFLMLERVVNESKKLPLSHITAINSKTKQQVSIDELSSLAKKIKGKNITKFKSLRELFRKAGIKVDKKYENVAYNAAKQLSRGEIPEKLFISLFVPRELRASLNEQPEVPTITTLAETQPEPQTAPTTAQSETAQLPATQPAVEVPEQPQPAPQPLSQIPAAPAAPAAPPKPVAPVAIEPKKTKTQQNPQPLPTPAPVTVTPAPTQLPAASLLNINVTLYVDGNDAEEQRKLIEAYNKIMGITVDNFGEDEVFSIVVKLGFLTLKHGNRQFVDFGKAILSQLGETARPFLKSAYEGARYYPGSERYRSEMTPSSVVETIDEKTFDKEDPFKEIRLIIEGLALTVNITLRNEMEKYTPISELPTVNLLINEFDALILSLSEANNCVLQQDLQRTVQFIEHLKICIQNFRKTLEIVAKEYAEFELRRIAEELRNKGLQTIQELWDAWVRTALQALSFYSTKLANNQPLTEDDIKNLNAWIASIKDQISTLETMQAPNNIYNQLITYYEYWSDAGITGDNSVLLNIVNVEETAQISSWRIFNTMHTRSLDESVAEDDDKIKLSLFTSDENFTEEANFEFKLGGTHSFEGKVEEGFPEKIYVVVTYKGHTFKPVAIWDTSEQEATEEDRLFGEQVRSLIKQNPGKKIKPVTISRTKGKTYTQPGGEMVLLTESGLVDDVYSISFDNDQEEFMLTRAVPVAGGKVLIRATKPNKTGRGVADVYTYSQDSSVQTAGNVVYMKRIKGSNKPLLPINVYSDTIKEGDAQLILDILTGRYTEGIIGKLAMDMPFILNGEYLGVSGSTQTIGLTCRDVLNLILPYGPFGRKGTDIVHIWHSEFGDSRIILSGKFKGDEAFQNREFDLSTVLGKQAFKLFLMENVRKNISERVMKTPLGKPGKLKDNPLLGLANFVFSRQGKDLRERLKAGEQIRLGNSTIVFDWEDLGNDKRQGGITGLGWYVKRGFLKTNYAGITGALINFTGAQVEEDGPTVPPTSNAQQIAEKPVVAEEQPEVVQKPRIGRIRRSLEKRSDKESEETRTVEEVRRVLSEIIPSAEQELTISVSEYYIDDVDVMNVCAVSAAAPHVVGRCYSDAIELYKHAEIGVAYHEAFHRICEIFLDDKERQRVYKRYENIYRLTHFGKKPTLQQIREGVADQFMMFMEQRKTNMGLQSQNIFRRLYNIARLFFKIGSFGQYKLYSLVANGRFKNFKMDNAALKRAENFAKEHPEGYGFEVQGVNFKYILNDHQFRDLIKSLVYFTFDAYWDETNKVNKINFDGSNISDLKVNKDVILTSESYKYYAGQGNVGSKALEEAIEHFDVIAPYIVSAISEFATDYKVVYEDLNAEEALDEDVSAASISEHTHQSYEFSLFSRASSRVRFFFSRIDDTIMVENEGETVNTDKPNSLGLPLFLPSKEIFNDVLNQLWDVEDLTELINRIAILAQDSPVYSLLYNRLNGVIKRAYKNGYNADEESLLVQIFNVIKSNKQSFLLAQASRYYQGGNQIGYTITILNTDQEYNARQYRFDWSNLFAHGGSIFVEVGEDGKLVIKKGMRADSMARYWGLITNVNPAERLGLAAAFSSDEQLRKQYSMFVTVDGKRIPRKIDAKNNKLDLDLCKIKFIECLNYFGIQFDKTNLDYMLRKKYGNSGFDGMQQMFQETGVASLNAVTFWMNGTYYEKDGKTYLNLDDDGRINGRKPERVFAYSPNRTERGDLDSNGFFGELANYKYQYRHAHDQLSVLAAAGNKFYVMSENNYITDTVHFLNRALLFYKNNDSRLSSEIEEFDELCNFAYNLIEEEGEFRIGSAILKHILDGNSNNPIEVCTLSGMKSDYRGDQGVDYATISRRDDYIAKLQILLGGGIIFPTLSDKKTWVFLKGILLPGINWGSSITGADLLKVVAHDAVTGQSVVDNRGRIRTDALFSYALQNKNEVVDQLIEYFITEHAAVAQTIADMKSLPEDRKVANYHGGQKVKDKSGKTHVVILGARHSSLLNLYDENGDLIPVSRVLDENGNYIDEETEWNNLDDLFFARREDETEEDLIKRLRIHVNRILKHRLEEELAKLEQMGLVKKVGTGNTIFDYENVGIDAQKVNKVYEALLSNYGLREGTRITAGPNGETLTVQDLTDQDVQRFRSLALAIVVNDGMVKSIMSKNETERIFSGHPSFYKWLYNEQGELVDRGVDQHKRYGGLVSTGQNAALWAKGVNYKYRSAEIDNEMVLSQQIELLERTIYEGTLRSTLINYLLDQAKYSIDNDEAKPIVDRVDGLKIEEVEKELEEISKELDTDLLLLAKSQAKLKTDDFRLDNKNKGIDVADGAAYVTDTFFEQMLRSIGAWNTEIERAFKILRGEEVDGKVYTIKDITTVAKATEAVLTAVIGTQKYTAYGQRMQTGWDAADGHHEGSTLIPYYDKFALFPLFKIICTGKMAHIYKAMQDLKVDMLKVKSAIKLGMEGSKPIKWSEWENEDGTISDSFHDPEKGFRFNVYEQRMKYLRKQFNTDPKEKEFLTMGTLMTKVVMLALTPGRTYTTQDGRTMTARELRDDVMSAMNEISKIGNEKFRKEFFNKDGSVNLYAFVRMIKSELLRRGASRDIIDGFTIIKRNGKEELKISPAAQSDISWIQSILTSIVNKRTIDINTPGNLFIQRSVWGMEGVTTLLGDTDIPESINGGRKLQLINEEGSMDCVLSIDYFAHIIPEGLSFKEAKLWLIDNEIISGVKTGETTWNNAKSNIVGYRIPTQAVSSIHAFRCVDVLPVVRDTVIMPEEITKVTGSDFDVDKMFLSMINYNVEKRKNVGFEYVAGKYTYVARDLDYMPSLSEYYQNKLLRDYISMLISKDLNGIPRNVQQLHGSIDKDTKLLTDVLDELESGGAFKERLTYEDYTLSNEVFIKQDYITGKNGIGPFALNNNNHVLTMLYGVKFKQGKNILTRLGLTRLDKTVDRDGRSIFSWLSGLINAHVDIAKDPYISRLGVNPFTYNMTNLLIRTGLGKYTFYFLTQPLIMLLAEAYTNAGGVYGIDRTKTVSQLRRESKQKFIINYINLNLNTQFSEYDYEDAMKEWLNRMKSMKVDINAAIDYMFSSKNSLMKNVSSLYKISGDKVGSSDVSKQIIIDSAYGHKVISMFDMQMIIYSAFEQLDVYANALSNVVKYSKIDTKKQGKDITQQRAYSKGVYNTFVSIRGIRKLFNNNLYKMYKNSYILQKTDIAINAFNDLVSSHMIQATPLFERQLNMIANVLNKEGESFSELIIGDISNAIMLLIKSRFINKYAEHHNVDVRGLVSGENTIYDRLVKLTIAIKTDKKYADLILDGEITNYLLRSLVTSVSQDIDQSAITSSGNQQDTYKNAKFVKLLNFLEEDQMDSDELRSAWHDLLYDGTHPELQLFAKDLIIYSFITSGDVGGGMRNLFKFVPNSWKLDKDGLDESYNDYMSRVHAEYQNDSAPNIDIEDLILNNWRNYSFVPTMSVSRKGGFRFKTYFANNVDYPVIIAGVTTVGEEMYPTFNENPDSEFYHPSPLYLKTKRSNEDINEYSQRSWNVYKRIAYGSYIDKNGTLQTYPIYVLVLPKGNIFEGNYQILEYGRLDQEYTEVANAITRDPVISALLMGTNQQYTDVESLLDLLSSMVGATNILTAYNNLAKTNLEFDDLLKFILQGYMYNKHIFTEGGTVTKQHYNRESVENDPENLYIFTDNTDRDSGTTPVDENSWYAREYSTDHQLHYPSTTTAQIRGLQNAYPISTQRYYHEGAKGEQGRWNDSDYDLFVSTIEKELEMIQGAWFSGIYKNIILPAGTYSFLNGFRSQITQERTPKLYEYLSKVEDRIRAMVELNIPMVLQEESTFKPGEHPQKTLLDLALSNTSDLLDNIAQNSLNKYFRDFVQKLSEYSKQHSVPIKYVHAGDLFHAHYMPNTDEIEINLDSEFVKNLEYLELILIHETMHSLTSRYLNEHPDDAEAIMKLAEYAKSLLESNGIDLRRGLDVYFKNAKEFITYATTDSEFRGALMLIAPMNSTLYESIFSQLLDKIKEILYKIAQITDPSVIKQIDPIVSRILTLLVEMDKNINNSELDNILYSDKHGNMYGWSVESIGNHLKSLIEDLAGAYDKSGGTKSPGLYKHMVNHTNEVNELYGTNFSVYKERKTKEVKIKWNTNPESYLTLSENPYEPKQLELFDNFGNSISEDLRKLGSDLMRLCGY